jgi:hypothetical protein
MTSYVQPLRSAGWGHQVGARLSARLDAARTAARARAAATRFRLALPVTGGHALPVLFAAYHLHFPWLIPVNLLDMFILSYPTKRYQSAWIGIVVHSAQSVFAAAIVLPLVL